MADVKKLIGGYRTFYQQYFDSGDSLYKELSVGQSPKTLIIACSDSRVDPAILTKANPGDIFVVRNVANLVPPYCKDGSSVQSVGAALEYAVGTLKVEHIVVLGHSQCGGIKALLHSDTLGHTDYIQNWVQTANEAKRRVLDQFSDAEEHIKQHACEKESILLSLENLLSFPWVEAKVSDGELQLHGWYFSIEDGMLYEHVPEEKAFIPIAS